MSDMGSKDMSSSIDFLTMTPGTVSLEMDRYSSGKGSTGQSQGPGTYVGAAQTKGTGPSL